MSVQDRDKAPILPVARSLAGLGFRLVATEGTAAFLRKEGLTVDGLKKIKEGSPNATDYLRESKIDLIINTPSGERPRQDEIVIRSLAVSRGVPCVTTIQGAVASVQGLEAMRKADLPIASLQTLHQQLKSRAVDSKPMAVRS